MTMNRDYTLSVINDAAMSFGIALAGTKVSTVSSSGLGAKAGLLVGDQLLSVNGKSVNDQDSLFALFRGLPHGETVTFSISRSG